MKLDSLSIDENQIIIDRRSPGYPWTPYGTHLIITKDKKLILSKNQSVQTFKLTNLQFSELKRLLNELNLKSLIEGNYIAHVIGGFGDKFTIRYKGIKKVFNCVCKYPSESFDNLRVFLDYFIYDFSNPYVKLNKLNCFESSNDLIDSIEDSWMLKYSKEESVKNKRIYNKMLIVYPDERVYRRIGEDIFLGKISPERWDILRDYFRKNQSNLKDSYGQYNRKYNDEFLEFKFTGIDLVIHFNNQYPNDKEFQEVLYIILNEFDRISKD